ncbi:PfkB family carbohydrate kinase, partial [Peribacillus frigoritolerans]|uniref:PfkB family carbohydrate kinase n=1 Tax=Peribacillus frigoritolerans TaxID=450367 RepID=UPI0035DA66BA
MFQLLTYVAILKISEEELHFLFGTNNENNSVQQLLNFGISLIIVTKGSQGSSYYTKNIASNSSS